MALVDKLKLIAAQNRALPAQVEALADEILANQNSITKSAEETHAGTMAFLGPIKAGTDELAKSLADITRSTNE